MILDWGGLYFEGPGEGPKHGGAYFRNFAVYTHFSIPELQEEKHHG